MSEVVTHIYWLSGGSSGLDEFPWADIEKPPVKVKIDSFENTAGSRKEVSEKANQQNFSIVIYDLEDESQLKDALKFFEGMSEKVAVVLLASPNLLDEIHKLKRQKTYVIQKPLRRMEFFLLLEKMVLLAYYKDRVDNLGENELDWLKRVEQVFEFSRQELLDRERTTHAYEKLVEYEEHLLEEQRRINQALLSLQEYRDQEKIDWEKERSARDTIEELQRVEMKGKDQTVLAQEQLLEFHRNEKLVYFRLLKEFEDKGSLNPTALKELFDEHRRLITTVQGLAKS